MKNIIENVDKLIDLAKEWGKTEYRLRDSDVGSFASDLKESIVLKQRDELVNNIKELVKG
jgi:uncharacterized tellurite resistance protein B-like protein